MVGCNITEPKDNSEPESKIKSGLYETRQNVSIDGRFYTFIAQIHFAETSYQISGFADDLELLQEKGTWVLSGEAIKTSDRLFRELNDAGSWGPWVSDTNGTMKVRNITETSFQKYLDASDIDPEVIGLSPGWLTYNRIGD
jgi:hypothetical protein